MCKFLKISTFLTLVTCTWYFAYAGELPAPFEARYSLYSMGTRFAEMQRSFSRTDDGNFIYQSSTRTVGLLALFRKDTIVEKSSWHLQQQDIQPLFYSYEHTGGRENRNVVINFDWSRRLIINSINGSSWQMPIQAYIMDKLLYQLAIMYDLGNGKEKFSYAIADGGKIKTYRFELVGEEPVETPLGTFNALKLVRYKPNSKRETTTWCARELGYLPIKVENIENSGRLTTAIIDELTGEQYEDLKLK